MPNLNSSHFQWPTCWWPPSGNFLATVNTDAMEAHQSQPQQSRLHPIRRSGHSQPRRFQNRLALLRVRTPKAPALQLHRCFSLRRRSKEPRRSLDRSVMEWRSNFGLYRSEGGIAEILLLAFLSLNFYGCWFFFVWGLLLRFCCDGGKIFQVLFVGPACGWWLGCWPVGMVELVMGLIWMVAEFYLCSFFLCEYGWIGMGEKKKMKAFFQVSVRRVLLGGCSGFRLVVGGWEREKNRVWENKDKERREKSERFLVYYFIL